MQNTQEASKSHAVLDQHSRAQKAKKIEVLLEDHAQIGHGRLLEVGCGSGFIVNHFSRQGYGSERSFAVDLADERQVRSGYQFSIFNGSQLPFEDNHFDLIISNHVIEHVGKRAHQIAHLSEIFRCLKSGGVFYIAVPNRWRFIEPHYKLPFLSWFGSNLASYYLQKTGRGSNYDCNPVSLSELKNLLSGHQWQAHNMMLDAIKAMARIEQLAPLAAGFAKFPPFAQKLLLNWMPTLIFVCQKHSTR